MNYFQHARTLYRRRHAVLRAGAIEGLRSVESMCSRRTARRRVTWSNRQSLGRRLRASPAPRSFRTLAGHPSRRR